MSPRRIAPVLVAIAAIAGCKNVTQEAPPQELVIATFDSGVGLIPTPSDLALASSPTLPDSNQKMMLQWFVQGGGFPGDQGVPVSVPLNHWVWNGNDQYVRDDSLATQPRIDPASVTSQTVVLLKVDVSPPVVVPVEFDADNSVSSLSFTPPPAGSILPGVIASGKLQVHKTADANGTRRLAAGRYVFAVRGGANGVKACVGACTTGSARIGLSADKPIALVAPNLDLKNPKNQPVTKLSDAQIAQLEQVRGSLWNPLSWGPEYDTTNAVWTWKAGGNPSITPAFVAASAYMPVGEIAAIGTFSVAAAGPTVSVDSDSGLVPLPIDLARTGAPDPLDVTSTKRIGYNAAFGPAAAGLTTLNGFSTTAMIFAPTSIPVDASTVNGNTVYLYKKDSVSGVWTAQSELKAHGPPAAVVAEPDPITVTSGNPVAAGFTCHTTRCSSLVALQPAVTAQLVPGSYNPAATFYLPPLDEGTDYAVVITTGVKTAPVFVPQYATTLSLPLGRSTMAKLLLETPGDLYHLFWATHPITGQTVSSLAGVSLETAQALQTMRGQLRFDTENVVSTYVQSTGLPASSIAMAYTFRTQGGMKATAATLAAAPYQLPGGTVADATFLSTAQVAASYGLDPAMTTTPAGLAGFAEVRVVLPSFLLASQNSGALDPAHVTTELVTALVAYPDATLVSTAGCADPTSPVGCAPLVVFSHGLTNSKADVLPIAAALASRGFVVAAIDAPLHGERSYCSSDVPAAVQCIAGSSCVYRANLTTPVDGTAQIGQCQFADGTPGYLLSYRADFRSVSGCESATDAGGAPKPACISPDPRKGTAFISGNKLVSLNFFRVRDALRQDVIDKAALAKALAPLPIGAPPDAFASALATGHGVAVDFRRVYLLAHSYGAISGAMTLTVNPRFTRAVTYAGGATGMDVFSNPASIYNAKLNAILSAAGIAPGSSTYLKTIQIGKWILDPADPANFLGFARSGALPNQFDGSPLASLIPSSNGGQNQPLRDVLVQISNNDPSVPNQQNTYYGARLGFPVPDRNGSVPASNVQWFTDPSDLTTVINHSNLLDFVRPTLTEQAQANAADFLLNAAQQATPVVP